MSGDIKIIVFMILVGIVFAAALVGLAIVVLLSQSQPASAPLPTTQPAPMAASPTFYVISTLPPYTNTPVPTNTPVSTNTPVASDTPIPTQAPPTETPRPTNPPPPPATNTPAPPQSSKGLTASFRVEGGPQFGVGQQIWFNFTITNPGASGVSYGRLGVAVEENGQNQSDLFHTSYSETTLKPGEVFNWRDYLTLPRAGSFALRLAICYPDVVTCTGGGQWEYLSSPMPVTIQ